MKDKNILNLLAAILTSATAPETPPPPLPKEFKLKENRTPELVENIRRQLMKDNYDYALEEATESIVTSGTNPYHVEDDLITVQDTTPLEINIRPFKQSNIINSDFTINYMTLKSSSVQRRSHLHDNRSKYLSNAEKTNKTHYDHDKSRKYENTTRSRETRQAGADRKVRYNMLKVRGASRRSASSPHLLKEEKENEMSIVNLGEGPVPEFRLPQKHRQYMQDEGEEPDSDLSYPSDATNLPASRAAVDLDR